MMNTNTVNTTTNTTFYINYEMSKEDWDELFDEVLGTIDKHPKRVKKVVRNKKINVEDFSSQR